ncbi:tyrosine recombinase XerC [Bacillus massilinigeriensis]|uniref:tyrosine recombinase XerC n=1 Tax=Bacillus massilionigeriensis TaxID=1805475 RepID=UPI00096B1A6B|nr:tyrosine recombinase XerC [Bacillus massilionigeriensis]
MEESSRNYLRLFIEYMQIEKNFSPYTIEYYTNDIEEFFLFMFEQSIKSLYDIQYSDVRLYLTILFEKKLSRKSISRKISSLRSFFKFLVREKFVSENPFALASLPKQEKRLPQFFYEEEMSQLFDACNDDTPLGQRNKALLELLYATGIRVSECSGLLIRDIDMFLSTVLVHGKGSKDRYVPFGSFAHDALEQYIQYGRKELLKNNHDYLFVNFRGGPITSRGIRVVLNNIIEKSSLTGSIHPHMIRHSFATHLLNNGADMRTVQELLGHAFLSSTQVYTHVTNEHLRKTYMNHHPRA